MLREHIFIFPYRSCEQASSFMQSKTTFLSKEEASIKQTTTEAIAGAILLDTASSWS
jgi:hypothetical protein